MNRVEISTLEKERARIASDLHDEFGPLITSVKFMVSSIDVKDEDEKLRDRAEKYLDTLIDRIREVSNALMPSVLLRKGLFPAIEEYIDNVPRTSIIDINFTHEENIPLNNEMAINFFRIIQELIHNAIKHSKATQLNLDVSVRNKLLVLKTDDNGVGFDMPTKTTGSSGLGLISINNRVEVMNGTCIMNSKKGKGTTSVIIVPLG